jgi:hypothetical protein
MGYYTRNMKQQVTYWAPGVNNGFGNLDFSGVERDVFLGRWQDDAVLFRDAQGQEQTSSAVVYLPFAVSERGYLCLGNRISELDPTQVDKAYEIRQVSQSPSLDGNTILVKVYL